MSAFLSSPLPRPPRHVSGAAKRCARTRWTAQQQPDDTTRPRFARDAAAEPETSFFEARAPAVTPNERALRRVEETMSRLGADAPVTPAPRPFSPIDVSRVNPLSAAAGSLAAGAIAYGAWVALIGIAAFFAAHPLDDQLYVVQRLGAVARTALVGVFALASGMSGVTALGLAALFGRTAYGRVSGEFRD